MITELGGDPGDYSDQMNGNKTNNKTPAGRLGAGTIGKIHRRGGSHFSIR
jgi:hypothetical protein